MRDQIDIRWAQMRKARWFMYIQRRFDLVSFDDLADWCAREPGNIVRNDFKRNHTLADLVASIKRGEFGNPESRCIPWLAKPPPVGRDSPCVIRLNYGQILHMGDPVFPELHITRTEAIKWLKERKIAPPAWMVEKPKEPVRASEREPFNDEHAELILRLLRRTGRLESRPSVLKAMETLRPHFETTPRNRVRKVVADIWGKGQRGRPRAAN